MSADLLRKAAEILRERAWDANAGPWVSESAGAWTGRVFGTGVDGPGAEMVAKTSTNGPDHHGNADYIATMHPGVGLALADWLDATAKSIDCAPEFGIDVEADALARLIVGE